MNYCFDDDCVWTSSQDLQQKIDNVITAIKENCKPSETVEVVCAYNFWQKLNNHKKIKIARKKRYLISRGYKLNKLHKTKGW